MFQTWLIMAVDNKPPQKKVRWESRDLSKNNPGSPERKSPILKPAKLRSWKICYIDDGSNVTPYMGVASVTWLHTFFPIFEINEAAATSHNKSTATFCAPWRYASNR